MLELEMASDVLTGVRQLRGLHPSGFRPKGYGGGELADVKQVRSHVLLNRLHRGR